MLRRKHTRMLAALLVIGFTSSLLHSSISPVFADSLSTVPEISQNPAGAVEKLVLEYYPRAVINKGRSEIQFEYKARKKNGFYPDRPAMVPMDGGIVGSVILTPGEYAEADKDEIPAEKPNGFYSVLTMAPFSKRQNSHLLARVIFPQDASNEFKEKFRILIGAYNALDRQAATPSESASSAQQGEKTAAAAAATNGGSGTAAGTAGAGTTSSASSSRAGATPAAVTTAAKSNYSWATVVRPDSRLSFKFPQGAKVKENADRSSSTWKGTADGVEFTVTVNKPNSALISDDQRAQAMNSMAAAACSGKKTKMEQAFNFQGLSAQEYSATDSGGAKSKLIVCVSAGIQYLFMAGGANFKSSKLPPEFFDGIKIGNIK